MIFNVPSVGFNTSFAVVLLGSVMSSTFFAAWIAASTAAFFVLSVIVDLATTPFFQKSESSVSPTHAARSFPSMPPFSVTVSAISFVYCALYVFSVTGVVSVGTAGVHGFFVSCVYSFFLPFTSFVPVVNNALISFCKLALSYFTGFLTSFLTSIYDNCCPAYAPAWCVPLMPSCLFSFASKVKRKYPFATSTGSFEFGFVGGTITSF